jgi:hypothetical protein
MVPTGTIRCSWAALDPELESNLAPVAMLSNFGLARKLGRATSGKVLPHHVAIRAAGRVHAAHGLGHGHQRPAERATLDLIA